MCWRNGNDLVPYDCHHWKRKVAFFCTSDIWIFWSVSSFLENNNYWFWFSKIDYLKFRQKYMIMHAWIMLFLSYLYFNQLISSVKRRKMQVKYRGAECVELHCERRERWSRSRASRQWGAMSQVSSVSLAPKSRTGLLFLRYAVPRRLVSPTTA